MSPGERERLDALVAAYRKLPRAEPSAEVDAAVLRGARDALRSGARPRWPALLATAATMTLAVGLAWQLREAEDRIEAERPAAVSAPPVAPVAPAPAAYEESVAGSRDRAANAADADRAESLEDTAAPSGPDASDELGAVADTEGSRRAGEQDDASEARAKSPPARERPASPREPELAREQDAVAPAKAEAKRSDAPLLVPDPPPDVAADERLLEAVPAPAAEPPPEPLRDERQPPAAPAAPAPPPPSPAAAARASAPAAAAPALRKQVEAAEARERAAPSALGIGQAQRADAPRDPEEWLDEILRLLRAGHRTRAIESLREFREAYPEVELPRELRDLAP